jgi:REP element-mobilizing transposase RayT
MHFIIINVGADLRVCPNGSGKHVYWGEHTGSPLRDIIQWFKTMTTNEYIRNVKNNGWKTFDGKLWQRNYYEHIIRNEQEMNEIREYIINNPLNWQEDENYLS